MPIFGRTSYYVIRPSCSRRSLVKQLKATTATSNCNSQHALKTLGRCVLYFCCGHEHESAADIVCQGYLAERKHLTTLPLSVLTDSRLGIDASQYLHLLLDYPPSREPLLAATGGPPLALVQRIEADLRVLEKLRIKPVFVFPGLVPNKKIKVHPQQEYAEAMRDRQAAWSKYEQGQEEAAGKLFEGRSCVSQWDIWRLVLRIFRHRNVEFLIAPYNSWAQVRESELFSP